MTSSTSIASTRRGFSFILKEAPFILAIFITPFLTSSNFPHPFQYIKFIYIFFAAIFGISLLFIRKESLYIPKIKNITSYFLFLLLFFIFLNYFIHGIKPYFLETYLRISFFSLFLYFFLYFKKEKSDKIQNLFLIIFFFALVFIILDMFSFIVFFEHLPYFTLGNPNMSAEYAGLTFGLMMGMQKKIQENELRKFFTFIIPLTASYIFFTNCRSAYIGILIVTIYFILTKNISFRFLFNILILFIIITFTLSSLQIYLHGSDFIGDAFNKGNSTLVRWSLFKNSIKMLFENPLGVGLGQYEFKSIPYLKELVPILNENMLFKSPHVEILRFMIEDGLLVTGIFFIFIISFFIEERNRIIPCIRSHPEIVGYFIFLSVHLLFQFPLDNPIPLSLTAFMVAYFFAKLNLPTLKIEAKKSKKISFILFLVLLSGAIPRVFSGYVDRVYPENLRYNRWACALDPGNWSSCLNVVSIHLSEGNYDLAIKGAEIELSKRPDLFPAMKYLAFSYLGKRDYENSCFYIKKYDDLFDSKSSLNALRRDTCKS